MPHLELALLGSPRIECDGAAIEVDTRKAIALLAYLALAQPGSPHDREGLAALFWPDVDESRAHGALRRTLSALNKALGGRWLRIERESVALERDATVRIDVDDFRARLAEGRAHGHPATAVCARCVAPLTEAVALYRDSFMAGFSLRDSPAFDDWQFFQAEGLQRQLAGALEHLVTALSAEGTAEALEQAVGYARRWLALDSLHEPAHRQLMLLYAWAGQRAAALRQYRECVRVLAQELGVAPLEETTRLYEAIRENRPPSRPAAHTPGRAAPVAAAPAGRLTPAGLPLVGRAAEWQALLASYQAAAPDGRLVVLEGEAGIGKTRLAETVLARAREQGSQTMVARCYAGEAGLAFGPFVAGLRGTLGAAGEGGLPAWAERLAPHWISDAARLLPELQALHPAEPPSALDSPGAQSRFFESLRQALLAALSPTRAGGPPGVLLLDDAHWIDEASLDLLTYLVRRWPGQPICIIVTWRDEEVPANHRLRQLLAEAQRAGVGSRLALGRLSRPAVAELAERAAAARPTPEAVDHLYRETEGLPFFVVEYLAGLGAAGLSAADWTMPGGVRNLLQARLARVDETGAQLLSTAAVIGRSFDFDTLHAASGRSDDETVGGLETLMAAGLVNEVTGAPSAGSGPAYDFSHEQLRSLVYEETSLARRRLLHRRVAEALAARSRRTPPPAGQIARHYQQAGREAEAAEYFQLAGDQARALFANAEALAHYRAALALGHPVPAALHTAIGDLLTLSGLYEAALTSYEQAAALSGPEGLGVLEHKLGSVYHRQGEWALAESHFQAALNALGPSAPAESRAQLYADWGLAAHQGGNTARAQALAQEALELAEAAGDMRALAQVHNLLGILAGAQGAADSARQHLERSLALAEQLGDPAMRVAALNNLALALGKAEAYPAAVRLVEQALALCTAQGDRHREAALHNNLADLLHAGGQAEAALAHVKQSVMIYAEIGTAAGKATLQPEMWKLMEW
ncbi:MAG: AAA family ATPase [Anaerolineales bacterium]|nr:AAA family ATPase [Anaerolineales bacterium]